MVLSEQASEYNLENIKGVGRRCCFFFKIIIPFTHPPLFSQGIRSHKRTLEGSSGRTYHPFEALEKEPPTMRDDGTGARVTPESIRLYM